MDGSSFALSPQLLSELRRWVRASAPGDNGLRLFERNMRPELVPGLAALQQGLTQLLQRECVVTNVGFYVGSANVKETEWHVDAEASLYGRGFCNLLVPLFVESEAQGAAMAVIQDEPPSDGLLFLTGREEDEGNTVVLTYCHALGGLAEQRAAVSVKEMACGSAYVFNTAMPHRALARGARLSLFVGFVPALVTRNPGIGVGCRPGFVDSVIACFRGEEEESTAVVAQRYFGFWQLRQAGAAPLPDSNPWVVAWNWILDRAADD